MSEPIQNKPAAENSTQAHHLPNPSAQPKSVEIALQIIHTQIPQASLLEPHRVDSSFLATESEWCWNIKEEGENLVWTTELEDPAILAINKQQFPVLQPTRQVLKTRFETASKGTREFSEKGNWKNCKAFLEAMGFSYSSGDFRTPTREQFVSNYRNFKRENPEFPELKFAMTEEILPPDAFVSTFLNSDITLSDRQELIHDYPYHVMPILMSIFQAPQSYRIYKDRLGEEVETLLEFLKKEPKEILAELNKNLDPPINESELGYVVATLKFMVGAAIDLLSGQILDYKKIVDKGDTKGGIKSQFYDYIQEVLFDRNWRSPLRKSVTSLERDFLENWPSIGQWYKLVGTIFEAAGLGFHK